jgi:cobaltochelatase CobS
VTDLPVQATCVAYLDCEGHPALDTPDERHTFDCLELDRLFNYCTYREWSRHDKDPRRGILLMGPSGSGKSTFFPNRFHQRGMPMYSHTARRDDTVADLVQMKDVTNGTTHWEDGVLLKAMREGVPFVIEEIDNLEPSQLLSLNEIIEKGRVLLPESNSAFVAKRGFQVFGTCNSSFTEDRTGMFRGTRGQNVAVSNRFYKYWYPYATPEQETACLLRIHPELGEEVASRMANFAEFTRKAADQESKGFDGKRISNPLSRRHLLDWGDMLKGMSYLRRQGEKIDLAAYTLNFVYTANMAREEQACIAHFLNLAFNDTSGA